MEKKIFGLLFVFMFSNFLFNYNKIMIISKIDFLIYIYILNELDISFYKKTKPKKYLY